MSDAPLPINGPAATQYDGGVDQAARPATAGIIPALDGVRGLAILLVLAHNLNPFEGGGLVAQGVGLAANVGWVGVQLFFVLSGFLISGILLDTRGSPGYYRGFFGRRVLRIFPLYYGVLLIAFVVLPRLGLAPARLLADREHRIWLWTYLINWAEPLGAGVAAFPHFWSLAVEEQFYLIWPFVVRRTTPRRLLQVAAALVVIAFASRVGLLLAGWGEGGPYMFTICRMDALGLGGAVAALLRIPGAHERAVRWRRGIAVASSAVFVAGLLVTRGYPRSSFLGQTAGYTILAVTFAALVLLAVIDSDPRPGGGRGWIATALENAVLRSFGKYSYAIYLFHQPLNQMIGEPLLQSIAPAPTGLAAGGLYMASVTAASYALAVASYHGYEKHFLALKRLFPSGPAQARRSPDLTAR
jgi:peptidoglycan/LPS O-acetylase OafA/YrhL